MINKCSGAVCGRAEPDLSSRQSREQSEDSWSFIRHNANGQEPVQSIHAVIGENKLLAEDSLGVSAATGICSRQIEPVGPEDVLRVDSMPVAKLGISDGASSFADWVDRFLSIPLDEFRPVDREIMEKMHDSYQKKIAKDDGNEQFLKSKMLLNKVVYDWQKSQGGEQLKEKTKAKLVSLCQYMQSEFIISSYIKHLVLLKVYRDSLYHKPISDGDRQLILEVLNSDLVEDRIITNKNLLFVDFYSLQMFYFFGALPNFEDGVNYKKAFDLLSNHHFLSTFFYDLFSPVSFTIFDSARFLLGTLELIQANEAELNLRDSLPGILRVFLMLYLNRNVLSEKKRCISWLGSISGFNVDMYGTISCAVAEFALFMSSMETEDVPLKRINQFKHLLERSKERAACQAVSSSFGECVSLFTYMRAQTVLNGKGVRVENGGYALAGRLFSEVAEHNPNHWSTVYSYYHQAGKWELAACAADHYARYWEGKSRVLTEYWSDISRRERDLLAESLSSRVSVDPQEIYDVDAVIKTFAITSFPSEVTVKGKQQKRHQQKRHQHKGISTAVGQKVHKSDGQSSALQQSSEDVAEQPLFLAPTGHGQDRPVIKSSALEANRPGPLSVNAMYRIKSAKGSIQPYEKLLSSHWNPKVWAVLAAVRKARISLDITKEREIYQQVMGNPVLKTCIGIERVWEERAWTELHQFDDFFRVGVLTCAMREDAKKWIKNARELYILPSLAHCMNLDQINADIDPEAVWSAVMSLLAQPELAPADINQEIRFRLRCLFSSMGHIYSLSAMINSRNANHLRQIANVWYGFKVIDPNYSMSVSK